MVIARCLVSALLACASLSGWSADAASSLAPERARAPTGLFAPRPDPDVPLPPDEAFPLSVAAEDSRTIVARIAPVENYYVYRDKLSFRVREPAGVRIARVELPPGEREDDPFFGKTEIFRHGVSAVVRLGGRPARSVVLDVALQGCNARIGICYPLVRKTLRITLPGDASLPSGQ